MRNLCKKDERDIDWLWIQTNLGADAVMAFDPMNEILYRLRQGQGKHVTLEAGNSLCLFGFFKARSMWFAFVSMCSICCNPASRFDCS